MWLFDAFGSLKRAAHPPHTPTKPSLVSKSVLQEHSYTEGEGTGGQRSGLQ